MHDGIVKLSHAATKSSSFTRANFATIELLGSTCFTFTTQKHYLYIATTICEILDKIQPKPDSYKDQVSFVTDRPGHDFRYAIDATKIENELGWKADENFETGIEKTINWYLKKYNNR